MTGGQAPVEAITLTLLYGEFKDMRADVMNALQKAAVFDARLTAFDAVNSDHEARIRVVERFRYTLMGAAGLIGAASGVVSALITAHH